ncbi:MAG: hypothetical protein MUF53_05300, partial [Gemmatimonadaceae bacterium]|nr:hypothetical protein [Gemmatimonadaceae bacterium]
MPFFQFSGGMTMQPARQHASTPARRPFLCDLLTALVAGVTRAAPVLVFATACSDASPPSASESLDPSRWVALHAVRSAPPAARNLLEAQERAIGDAWVNALSHPGVRNRLRALMREKSDVEQKLLLSELLADAQLVEFRRVLREADVGRHLPAALRPAANAETFSVEDCPISRVICPDGSVHPDLPPVTIYMPIDAHRTTWDGSQPTITAPIAGDQWDWVIARAPGGVDVSIHTDSIPPLHTWVITPLEAPAEVRADGQPGAPVFTRTLPLREYISHMIAERSFEHRLLGRPEFRFYVASGFTCEMTWEGYCKWKANRNSAYYGRIDIPESMWSAGERANQAFRPVPGRLELVNWNAVPTNPMFGIPDVLVPKEPVTVLCMERDFG